jgi:hypothetical protein
LDTIFSLLGLYQLSALVVPGAVATGGIYYAVQGMPPNPTAAAVLGLLLVFFVVGASVQGVAVLWEKPYWKATGGLPSDRLVDPGDAKAYAESFRQLLIARLDAQVVASTASLPSKERFVLARAELRRQNQDGRAESLNATYGLSRGIVTAGAVTVIVALICACVGHAVHRNLIVAAVVAAVAVPIGIRFHRFAWWFAREVWQDFAALAPRVP